MSPFWLWKSSMSQTIAHCRNVLLYIYWKRMNLHNIFLNEWSFFLFNRGYCMTLIQLYPYNSKFVAKDVRWLILVPQKIKYLAFNIYILENLSFLRNYFLTWIYKGALSLIGLCNICFSIKRFNFICIYSILSTVRVTQMYVISSRTGMQLKKFEAIS
jgi:hypothetical protein